MTTEERVNEFSIERFESVMLSTNTSWKDINSELGYNAEKMLKNKHKKPMLNVINKACDVMGLTNSDYVMMNSGTYTIKDNAAIESNSDSDTIKSSIIDAEMLDLFIKDSDWNYKTISSLMQSKSAFTCKNYTKTVKTVNKHDISTLCWALDCKISDICKEDIGDLRPDRYINDRQEYILNTNYLSNLPKLEDIAKKASVPLSFLQLLTFISLELVAVLCNAIKVIIGKDVTGKDICTNFDNATIKNSNTKNNAKKQIKEIIKVDEPKLDIASEIKYLCEAIIEYISKPIYVNATSTKATCNINIEPYYDNDNIIMENDKYFFIRKEILSNIRNGYFIKHNLNNVCSLDNIMKDLANEGIIMEYSNGNNKSKVLSRTFYNKYTGSNIRYVVLKKEKVYEFGGKDIMVQTNQINPVIPDEIVKSKIQTHKETCKFTVPEYESTNFSANYNKESKKYNMKDILNKVDSMTDEDIDKLVQYIYAVKKIRELKSNLS